MQLAGSLEVVVVVVVVGHMSWLSCAFFPAVIVAVLLWI